MMMQLQRHSARDSGSTPLLRGMRSEKGRSSVEVVVFSVKVRPLCYCSPPLVWTRATRRRRCVMTRIPGMCDCSDSGNAVRDDGVQYTSVEWGSGYLKVDGQQLA